MGGLIITQNETLVNLEYVGMIRVRPRGDGRADQEAHVAGGRSVPISEGVTEEQARNVREILARTLQAEWSC